MPGEVHRLRDIDTREVSLVDRPANKRKFLLAKRDGETTMLKPDGRGGFVKVSKSDDAEETKRKSAESEDEMEKTARVKARMMEGDDEKECRVKAGKSFYEVRENRKRIFDNEDSSDEAKRSRKAKKAARKSATDTTAELEKAIACHIDQVEAVLDAIEQDASVSPANTQKLAELYRGLGEVCKKHGIETVEKVGRKMAASRLDIFQKALDNLQSLLNELMEAPSGVGKEHSPQAGDPQKAPTGFSAANPSDAPTGAAGTAGGVTKADAEKIAKAASDLVDVTKAQAKKIADLEAEIRKMKAGEIPAGNSITVEKSGGSGKSNDVTWPLDMNRPIDKSTVNKSESFYDD